MSCILLWSTSLAVKYSVRIAIITRHPLQLLLQKLNQQLDYLVAHGKMKEDPARKHFRQIVSAVSYCHSLKIIHRDLKAENILLDADFNVKIADFGFSTQFREGVKLNTWCGSPPYACPELFLGKEYVGPEVDIWSIGVILYVLTTGSLPFDASSLPKLRAKIIAGKFKAPYFMSSGCERIIRKMVVVDPTQRTSLENVKRETWFNEGFESEPLPAPRTLTISPELHQTVLQILDTIGLEAKDVERSLQNGIYDHHLASYYLIADREVKKQLDEVKTATSPVVPEKDVVRSPVSVVPSLPPKDPFGPQKIQKGPILPEIGEEESVAAGSSNGQQEVNKAASEHSNYSDVIERVRSMSARRRRNSEDPSTIAAKPVVPSLEITNVVTSAAPSSPVELHKPKTRGRSSTMAAPGSRPIADLNNENVRPIITSPSPMTVPQIPEKKSSGASFLPLIPLLPLITKRRDRSKTIEVNSHVLEAAKQAADAVEVAATGSANSSKKSLTKTDEPRTLRFTFSVSTTSTREPAHLLKEIQRVMAESGVSCKNEAYVINCELDNIAFEIEICKIPRLSVNGLRVKRLTGNSWEYKSLVTALIGKMDI